MSRSKFAKWDPPIGGTFNWIKQVGASERDELSKPAGLLAAALMLSLLLHGCAHARAVDRALNGRCLAACEGWGGGGMVALCGVDGGCVCQSWEGEMVRLEGVCPVQVRS